MRLKTSAAAIGVLAGVACGVARADSVDLVRYLTRAGDRSSTIGIVAMVVALMLVNYALNFLVIGIPAIRYGSVRTPVVARGLIVLTLLGQVADRVGALATLFLSAPVARALRLEGGESWAPTAVVLSFVFSGITVGLLAFGFVRWRWHVRSRVAWAIAVAAAVITNPAWAFALELL